MANRVDLAGPIRADQADAVAGIDAEANLLEDTLSGKLLGEITDSQHTR